MINTSAAFKAAIQENARQLALKATLKVGAQTYELTGSDFEGGSLSATTACMSKGFELGTAIAADLSFALNNRSGAWNDVPLDGATIWPYAGLKLAGGTTEYVPLGTFIIDQPGRPYASLQVKAADRMILLDRPFSDVTITYPATFLEILQAICLKCNVPLSTQALSAPNISTQVTAAPTGEYSCRDIVAEISLYAAGFARMSRVGELEIVGLSKPEALTAYNMPIGSRFSFTQTTDAITITGLKYGDQLWGTSDYTVTVDKLALNPSSSLLQSVFDQISSFTYVPYNAEYPGNPALEAGDPVLHTTRDGKTILSLITKHKYKHGGRCSMTAEGKSASEVSYRSANERRLSQAAAQVKAEVEQGLTTYEQSSAQLADMLGMMMGTYRTVEKLESGAETLYFHDQPTLAESMTIWKFNGEALGISNDGGQTWATGLTADSNLIIQQIRAVGISAESIYIGGGTTVQDKINEFDAIEIGGRNLLRDSGTVRTTTRFISVDTYEDLAEYIGENVVVSFDLRIETDGVLRGITCAYAYQANGISVASDGGLVCTPSQLGVWQRFSAYTQVKDWLIVNPAYVKGAIAFYDSSGENHYSIRNIKIEKGNKATDWTPAPEDVAAEIVSEAAAVQIKAEQAAADYADKLFNDEIVRADAYADNVLTLAEQEALQKSNDALSKAQSALEAADESLRAFVKEHVSAETSQLKTYIRTDPVNGNLLIGAPGSQSMLRQSNLQMTFEYNGVPVAYFGAGETDMPKAGVDTELRIGDKTGGNYYWISDADGGMSLVWK